MTTRTTFLSTLALLLAIAPFGARAAARGITIAPIRVWHLDHVGGDCEMKGHHPHIHVDVSVVRNGSRLVIDGNLDIREGKRDFTEFRRHFHRVVSVAAPPGAGRWTGTVDADGGKDNHRVTRYEGTGIINQVMCLSDTKGPDCDRLGCDIFFRPIPVEDTSPGGQHPPALAPPGPAKSLYLVWVGVIDNGEGDGLHGPLGNLHAQVWDASGHEMLHTILEGPSEREYLDGDQASYDLYLGTVTPGRPIRLKIWESDPGPFRDHDTLFDTWIDSDGLWRSGLPAAPDAIRNAIRRGADSWVRNVWPHGIRLGIPKMFVRLESR